MKSRHLPALTAITAALCLLSGCFGPTDSPEAALDRPEVDDPTGRTIVPTIHLLTKTAANDPTRYEMSRMIVEAWQEAGVDAELMPVDDAQLNSLTFESKDYEVYAVSYGPTPERLDPDNLLSRFAASNASPTGSNVSMYTSDAYDAAYAAQATAADEEMRRESVLAAQELLCADVPAVPIFYPTVGAAYRSDRWENIEGAVGNPLFNVWNATRARPLDGRDSLVVGTVFEPASLNPVTADRLESQLPLSLIYDTLLATAPDGSTVERAAEEVTVDGTEVTLTLRPGMTFSDGEPVRAEDVAFSIEYLKDNNAPLYAGTLAGVEDVTTQGDQVTITLDAPAAHFKDVALTMLPVLPEHVWADVEASTFTNEEPVGSGPFDLTDRDVGSSLTFTSVPTHYDPAQVSTLELVILGNFEAGIGALESGEIDLYDDVQPALQYQSLADNDTVTVVETQSHGWRGLHYNLSIEPFDDVHFRQALTALIPYEEIIDVVMQGGAEVGSSVIAPSLEQWHNDACEPLREDPAAAMTALAGAGYAFGPDGALYYPDADSDNRSTFAD